MYIIFDKNRKEDLMMAIYTETFVSPFEKNTKSDALKVLEAIRQTHDSAHGWVEIEGYVEQLPNGKWRAVRKHEKRS